MKYLRIFFLLLLTFAHQAFCDKSSTPSSKHIFITGAAGFIGSNFLEYMFDKYPDYQFTVLDSLTYAGSLDNIPEHIRSSPRFTFVHDSVVNYAVVEELMSSANYVVHFAAETHVTRSIANDIAFFSTDVMGTRALMEALVKHRKTVDRFIHISTSEVYGTADYQPMDEKHPLNPRSPYAAAKAGADRLVYAYSCTYDIPTVIIRPFNNYGPRQHLEKMIPRFVSSAIENRPLSIHGNGEQSRDWIHTHDVAVALDKTLHLSDFSKIRGQEINIGTGRAISVLEIAKMILKEFGLPEDYLQFTVDRPGQVDCHISSTEKSKELLGWTPAISIEEGLKMTVDWYKCNPSHWQKMKTDMLISIEIEDYNTQM